MNSTNYTSIYVPNVQFTAQDIAMNRQGILMPDQESRIESIYSGRQRGATQTVKWMLIFFVPLLLVGAVSELSRTENPIPPQFLLLPFGMLFAVFALSGVFTWYVGRHVRARKIHHVEGMTKILMRKQRYSRGIGSYMRYEVTIRRGWVGGKRFRLGNQSSLKHFTDGQRMRVYYIPYYPFDIILSAEVV